MKEGGHDVETVSDLGRREISNSDLLGLATKQNRILVTFDQDFLLPHKTPHKGVLLVIIVPNTDDHVLPVIRKYLKRLDTVEFPNKIVILTENSLRINSYRVLLTRSRDGFVIFCPSGPEMLQTRAALAAAGIEELA